MANQIPSSISCSFECYNSLPLSVVWLPGPPLGQRGSVPSLTALSALTRIFKGGDAQTAPQVAAQVVRIAERLLGKLSQTQEIPVADGSSL